ncbi:hypothetical protein LZ198_39655 [Myxococcus sp. K15C18031901]|uniref:hypothetical protein n=1 Tax=Myxococcus dinghuensis TaxID=2906761 RepID=UPI0020A7F1DB|nr:hypothetical protein [Myxococcus dinghuensis]MCP3105000.1 hypothetical protein [Myxococcus dinghuensis]
MRKAPDMSERGRKATGLARFFRQQPDRIAALWRRMRLTVHDADPAQMMLSQLDGLVEAFIREIGVTLEGDDTSPWSRTKAVLRLSPERGARALHEEFAALRRCLVDASEVLGGGEWEKERINRSVDEAVDSAVALLQKLRDSRVEGPRVPFGGLVVEYFERPSRVRHVPPGARDGRTAMH